MKRICEACGRDYVARTTRARFCSSTCRSRVARGQVRPAPGGPPREVFGDLSRAVLDRLRALGMQDSPRGLVVLLLARHADANAAYGGPAHDLVALIREIGRTVAELEASSGRSGMPPVPDEVSARRAARRRPARFGGAP